MMSLLFLFSLLVPQSVTVSSTVNAGRCTAGATGVLRVDEGDARTVTFERQVEIRLNEEPVLVEGRAPCTALNSGIFNGTIRSGANTIVAAEIPFGYFLRSMTADGVDLTKAPLIKSTSLSAPLIEVVISTRPPAGTPKLYKASGRVTSDDYPLDSRLRLTLEGVPAMGVPERFGPGDISINRKDGTFEIIQVLPGRYTLRYGAGQTTFDVAGGDVTSLELKYEPQAAPLNKPAPPVPLNPSSISSIKGTVTVRNGTTPKFEIGFTPTREGSAAQTLTVSTTEFSVSLPEGEYRVRISGLPEVYTVESVSAGPLDLTEPFLVTKSGIADRFTGVPNSAGITVRLIPPLSN